MKGLKSGDGKLKIVSEGDSGTRYAVKSQTREGEMEVEKSPKKSSHMGIILIFLFRESIQCWKSSSVIRKNVRRKSFLRLMMIY